MKPNSKIIIKEIDFSGLHIDYQLFESPFGIISIASTKFGICFMEFCETDMDTIFKLKKIFPKSILSKNHNTFHDIAMSIFNKNEVKNEIKLHIKASKFQIDVWKRLLQIPNGVLTTYSEIAHKLGNPKACRAVGNAVGKNPIAIIIPCHRIIKKSGEFGNYKWGITRKIDIINWEKTQL